MHILSTLCRFTQKSTTQLTLATHIYPSIATRLVYLHLPSGLFGTKVALIPRGLAMAVAVANK